MKKIISILALNLILLGSMFASFPVKKNNETIANPVGQTLIQKNDATAESANASVAANKVTVEKSIAPIAGKSSGFDQELLITLLLWFFLGIFAAHRWYKGKPVGWNILFIITAGGCGVWAIVDLVNILTGKF